MITKAIVLGRNVGTNEYSVRIPYFEDAGSPQNTFTAILSTSPSLREEYTKGDIVFVGFEDHHIEKVVILGSLFTQNELGPRGFSNIQSLNVSDSATLPLNTKIGNISGEDLESLFRKSNIDSPEIQPGEVPAPPTTDGTYLLKCIVVDGTPTYSWVKFNVSKK